MSDREALKIFSRQPVSQEMIQFLVATTSSIIQVKGSKPQYTIVPSHGATSTSTMLVSPVSKSSSLVVFIKNLIKYSNVQTPTLMATLVYLNKLRNILPANAVGMETTRHRIFLAALILSAKSLNDSSPLNKHWTKYTDGLLTNDEVNMAERELISLLKWNVSVKEDELIIALQPFLASIKHALQKQAEDEIVLRTNYYRASNAYSKHYYAMSSPETTASSQMSSPGSSTSRSTSSHSIASYNSSLSLANSHSLRSFPSAHSSYNNLSSIVQDEEVDYSQHPKKRMPLSAKSSNFLNVPSSYEKQHKPHSKVSKSSSHGSSFFEPCQVR